MAASVIASEVPPARRGGLTPRRNGEGPAGQCEGDADTGRRVTETKRREWSAPGRQ